MTSRKISNPLALAVLACLVERPMHPYEMASTLRFRHKEESIRLNYGSLYTVVGSLEKFGFIEPQEVEREGRRPERTVYRITGAGHAEFVDWLSELLSTPVKEYPQFEAALSLLGGIPPDVAVTLLDQRCARLEEEIERVRSECYAMVSQGFPRLFAVETEYRMAMLEAEMSWTRRLISEITSGEIGFVEEWAALHAGPEARAQAERKLMEVVTKALSRIGLHGDPALQSPGPQPDGGRPPFEDRPGRPRMPEPPDF
jgi:DNA-binding PadR family transcriptional regulator